MADAGLALADRQQNVQAGRMAEIAKNATDAFGSYLRIHIRFSEYIIRPIRFFEYDKDNQYCVTSLLSKYGQAGGVESA